MNIRTYTKVFLLFSLLSTPAFARTKHPASGALPSIPKAEGLDFIENKGQWVEQAKFKATIPGGVVFLTDKGFVYHYVSQEDKNRIHELTHEQGRDVSKELVRHHAYRVNFSGANTNIKYVTESKRNNYNNYFIGNDQSKWASNVGLFGKVTQQNVYNGIDIAVYSKKNSMKYDFMVAPGADVNQIAMTFEGVQPELTAEGNIRIKTSVNEVVEQAPYSYQIINGKETPVKSRYKLASGKLSFEFPEGYNHQAALVIDPVLVFATYSGGTNSSNFSVSTTYDQAGNLYAAAYGGDGWPTTLNAFQDVEGDFTDCCINKYSALGNTLIFSTYYGGAGSDYANAMIVNDQNELLVAGWTSSTNLPTSTGCYDNSLNGSADIFVAHFNATGTGLLGGTYIGGSGSEPTGIAFDGGFFGISSQNTTSPVELNFDENGNIWVVSSTPSNDFPVTANAQQTAFGGGGTDGVIFKMNSTCSNLMYSSYLGGTGDDAIVGINFNSSNNLVICGATKSTNFPTTAGALLTTAPGGTCDGFVTIVNAGTGALMQSTFVGTTGDDQAVNIQLDDNNNIFVLGRTTGAYPVSAGVYSMANADVFIDKLNPTLSASLLSTRVGNPQTGGNFSHYFPTAFLHDVCGNTYVAGLNAEPGLPTTADAFQTGHTRFWFVVLEPNFADILFGSYFGALVSSNFPDHTHVGVNRLDPEGVVYHSVCANAPTGTFPTTPGSYAPSKQNSGQDIISFKFDFEATGVSSDFNLDPTVNGNDTGCAPYTVKFHNTSTSSETYIWDFGDGTPTATDTNPTHTFTAPGTYEVILYAHADSSCITDDTAYMTITVLKTELPDIVVNDTTLCSFQQSIQIGVQINNPSPNNTILWQPATGILSNPTLAQITVDPSLNNLYYVTVKDTIPGICGFSATDTVHIDLSPRQLDIINNDTVVCEGTVIPLTVVSTPGYTYIWTPSTGVSDTTILSPTITVNQPNIYTIRASYPGCPDTLVSINIGMHYNPTLELGPNKTACQWEEVAFESTVTPYRPDYIYQWTPSAGLSYSNGREYRPDR